MDLAVILLSLLPFVRAATAPCTSAKSEAAFLTGVVEGLPVSYTDSFCSATSSGSIVSPDQTGVSHYVLPGFIPKQLLGKENQTWKLVTHEYHDAYSSETEPAVVHLWLRAVCIGEETTIRGFGMLQGKAEAKESIHGQFELDLKLISLPGELSQQHHFKVYWRDTEENTRFHAPFTVEVTIPFKETIPRYRIIIGGFHKQAVVIFAPQVSSCQANFERKEPALFTVFPPSYIKQASPNQLELIAKLLVVHVEHHLKLGLIGTVHYEVEPYLSYLANHPEVHNLISQGTLRLIRWDLETQLENAFGILLTGSPWHVGLSRSLQYNHAMLAHWAMDVYMNPLDNDEFLATKEPTTVAKMLSDGCIMNRGHTTDMRYDIRCGSCQGNETDLWLKESNKSPLAYYNETDWRVRLRGKPVIHVDNTFSMAIHEAGIFHHGRDHYSECFFHIHMVNLFSERRDHSDNDFTDDMSWNWALDEPHV